MAASGRPLLALAVAAAAVAGGVWFLRRAAEAPAPLQPTRLFEQVLGHIRRFGVDSLSESELFHRAARGLVQELDDEFAALVPASASAAPGPDAGGLGILIFSRGGRLGVLGTLPDSPADSAGLARDDQLLEVGRRPVDGTGRDSALRLLHGPPGSEVRVVVRRPLTGQVHEYTLTRGRPRERVLPDPVDLPGGIRYLRPALLGPGTARVAARHLASARGLRGLVLDLRGSSAGVLEEAVEIAGLFLERGDTVVTVRGRSDDVFRADPPREGRVDPAIPVAVLVDGGTADAAEVLAAALQDHDRALVVGEPTFGRGTTPEEFTLDGTVVIRISTRRWFAPRGRALQPDSAAPPDSLPARPVFTTVGGRTVRGGGGVVPDSLVGPRPHPEPLLAFLRAVGGELPAALRGIRAIAAAAPGRPDADLLERVRAALEERGVRMSPEVFRGAADWILAEARRWEAAVAGGWPGRVRHAATTDPALRLALRLLREARTAADLVRAPAAPTG